jgi:hypothetical protein
VTISADDHGPAVGHAHQRLIELGYSIAAEELTAAAFGPSTQAAVLAFQQDQRIDVDGIIGIQTTHRLDHPRVDDQSPPHWRYNRSTVHAELVRVTDAAVHDLGRREEPDGSNDGPALAKFRTRGAPWCMLAVSHWFSYLDGGSPFGRMASTVDFLKWGHGRAVEEPQPGDVWMRRRSETRGHVALIVTVLDDGRLCCVGGNEGNRVRASIRRREDATAIIRAVVR